MHSLLHQIARGLLLLGWTPLGRRLWVRLDDRGDRALVRVALSGRVRAFDVGDDGSLSRLLIELAAPIEYRGHYRGPQINWLTAESCLAWRRLSLFPLSWSAVRLVDAPSFADSTYDRTVATGRLALSKWWLGARGDKTTVAPLTLPAGSLDEYLALHLRQISTAARKMTALLQRGAGAHQLADIAMVVSRILVLAEAITPRLPAPRIGSSRDPELLAILDHIKTALQSLALVAGPEHERQLAVIQSFAAAHALALCQEICRLDEVLLQ